MAINMLVAEQATTVEPFHDLPCSLIGEGILVLLDSVQACDATSTLAQSRAFGGGGGECASRMGGVISPELFIARVQRAEEKKQRRKTIMATQPVDPRN